MSAAAAEKALEALKEEALDTFTSCTDTELLLLLTFIDWLKQSGKLKLTKRRNDNDRYRKPPETL
ncbi:MAG: hypothetical protein JNK24_05945 [Alphaproteobacteria bacterium]|nr:hypothetical protein [Alphaproteobacteria bacterium]